MSARNSIIENTVDRLNDIQVGLLYDMAHDKDLKNELPKLHKQIMTLYRNITARSETLINKLKDEIEE